ncbi:MAG: polysaccharide biosynthesis protein, partial [Christensenellaceae bacterium]
MQIDRSKNSIRNIASGVLSQIVSLILPFVIHTIIIKQLGAEYSGLNGLYSSILQVLSLTELGFATAMVFSMYKPIAE